MLARPESSRVALTALTTIKFKTFGVVSFWGPGTHSILPSLTFRHQSEDVALRY